MKTRKPALFLALALSFLAAPSSAATSYLYRVPVSGLQAPPPTTCTAGSQAFNYTGAPVTFVMPAACTTLSIMAWGAGGGGSTGNNDGGPGGFASGTLSGVTPGSAFLIEVGQGGSIDGTTTFGGGGAAGAGGGSGGGLSAVLSAGTGQPLVVAGGGGGAGYASGAGGSGGGTSGIAGLVSSVYGTVIAAGGGTQSAGGIGGSTSVCPANVGGSGTFFLGGAGAVYGGGGGGGYYGGGGGGESSVVGWGGSCDAGEAGGGGSGYVAPQMTAPTLAADPANYENQVILTAPNPLQYPNLGTAGNGACHACGPVYPYPQGNPGLVVLSWSK